MLCVLGLTSASAIYACAFCYAHKDHRWACDHKTSKDPTLMRTMEDLMRHASPTVNENGKREAATTSKSSKKAKGSSGGAKEVPVGMASHEFAQPSGGHLSASLLFFSFS